MYFKGITSDFHDIDLMVADRDAESVRTILSEMGESCSCYNIITILYLHDRVEFKIRYEKMKSEFDKMTVNRVKNILREIDEEYPLSTNS